MACRAGGVCHRVWIGYANWTISDPDGHCGHLHCDDRRTRLSRITAAFVGRHTGCNHDGNVDVIEYSRCHG
jgi:hypothetical protein